MATCAHVIERWDTDVVCMVNGRHVRPQWPDNIRAFVNFILSVPWRIHDKTWVGNDHLFGKRPFGDLADARFNELLAITLLKNGKPITVDTLAQQVLLRPTLKQFVKEDLCWYQPWDRKEAVALMRSSGLDVAQFRKWIADPARIRALGKAVWPRLREQYAQRTLQSFFLKERKNSWFAWPDYPFGAYEGKRPKGKGTRRVPTKAGDVWVECHHFNIEEPAVRIYGWRGTLVNSNHDRLAVAACCWSKRTTRKTPITPCSCWARVRLRPKEASAPSIYSA